MWLPCKTRAKILLYDPETSLTTSRLLPLTIILKLAIVSVLRIVTKYFETIGAIGTIIWKPGLTTFTPEALTRFSKFGHFSEVDLRYTFS